MKAAAAGRPPDAPLLLWRDDRGWGAEPSANYRDDVRASSPTAGLDPTEVTAYALRHSSIVRQLLANVPVRVVASVHDTSVLEIERHYSKFISEHSDQLSRRALARRRPPSAKRRRDGALTVARKVKLAPPTPGELRREQPRAIRDLLIDPRLRAQLEEVRKAAEAAHNLLSPQQREFLRLWHEQRREAMRFLRVRIDDEPSLLPPSPPPALEKTRRGAPGQTD